jgi:poly-gamma-glutamate synthesis protein (capsule biosynthesis protein)
MLITGDIASPSPLTSKHFSDSLENSISIFRGKTIISNLEGMLYTGESIPGQRPVLYNHPSVAESLTSFSKPVFCLANNHSLDLESQYQFTCGYLNSKNIPFTGIGTTGEQANAHLVISEGPKNIVIFNACWDFLLYKTKNPKRGIYIHEIDEIELIKHISKIKRRNFNTGVIVYLHWNLDYESLPFPMHRKFGKALIDAGADVVAGSHSHCIQGGEKYKDGYIIYGLGNFFIPHGIYIEGRLSYPDISNLELVLEWDPFSGKMTCHFFEYSFLNSIHKLKHVISENFEDSAVLSGYSPFRGMEDDNYLKYFRSNRKKRILIPVYNDFKSVNLNRIKTSFLKSRARVAYSIARTGLKKW